MKKFNNISFILVLLLVVSIGIGMAANAINDTQTRDNILQYRDCTGWFDGDNNIPRYCAHTGTTANFLNRAVAIVTYNGSTASTAVAATAKYSSDVTAYRTPTYAADASNCGHKHGSVTG